MSYKSVGGSWAGAVDQPKDEIFDDDKGRQITRVYRALYATWESYAPSLQSPHPVQPLCKLATRRAAQIEPGVLCDVTLRYVQDEPDSAELENPPPMEKTENGSIVELPIESHPDFNDPSVFPDAWKIFADINGKKLYQGLARTVCPPEIKDTWVLGTGTVTVTTYSASEPSNVRADTGKIKTPPGESGAGRWLVLTGFKGKQGKWWAKTLVYQNSEIPWPPEVYDNA